MAETGVTTKVIENIEKSGLTVAVKFDEPLSKHTTFRIGGRVCAMYFPENEETTVKLCRMLRDEGITPAIIGRGSNVLARDKDLDIIVINTTKLTHVALTDTVITAQSGVTLAEISTLAYNNSLTGMEFAHGIPGTLGGAVVMNAGAYDGEVKDIVTETKAFSFEKGEYTIRAEEHEFSYRSSIFQGTDDVILSSVISLKHGDKEEIKNKITDFDERRRKTQPLDKMSAGSTFKRPKDGYAAALIENAGLKGYSIGGAQVSDKHAGFVVNNGNATFDDVYSLIRHVTETVEKTAGIVLEPEVKIWM